MPVPKKGENMSAYWSIHHETDDILKKAQDLAGLDETQAKKLLQLDLESREVYAVMETADRISRELFAGKGENHFHIGVNIEPCPFNCRFCSLAKNIGVFTETSEFSIDEIISWARIAEANGADALNIMTSGTFELDKLIDIAKILKSEIITPLVANTCDITHKQGERLLAAGFAGFYHALRAGEGRDTPFSVEKRLHTIRVIRDVGLLWMNCVEPIGPEHSSDEIAHLMVLAREFGATYSGVMRRINFPGSPFEPQGMISERELARMVAVSRLVMGDIPRAHCTHEPHSASLIAGANLFFPEVGASPRDSEADTGRGRGRNIETCRELLLEMGWNPDLESNCFNHTKAPETFGMKRHTESRRGIGWTCRSGKMSRS